MNADTRSAGAPAPLRRLVRWWHVSVSGSVDHAAVIARVTEESGWSLRFVFMALMSAAIAVLGLLLSSPAVVIGAMLISPLMGPIMGLGFSLALFDFAEMRRSIAALAMAAALAVAFTALIVLVSPLKASTPEILARTRPNLFDLLVALFSALAGAFALIRGRGETIVGVAIATALMPPLATVGYGLATMKLAIAGGAFALFATNFVTIALAATVMARLYGFGHQLSAKQSWLQNVLLLAVFVVMAIPLGLSLNGIAREALIATQVRGILTDSFGRQAVVTRLDIDYASSPIDIHAVIVAPRAAIRGAGDVARAIEAKIGQKVALQADRLPADAQAGALEQERSALAQSDATQLQAQGDAVARLAALAAGTSPGDVLIDRDAKRAQIAARPLPGAPLAAYRALEARIGATQPDWSIHLVPPAALPLPEIAFANGADTLDDAAREAVLTSAWAAQRRNWPALAVPGLTLPAPAHPTLTQRRAAAVAAVLADSGVAARSAAAVPGVLHLVPAE
jgi:uncharacterized hydrophobic protein (TIGR00271 family)